MAVLALPTQVELFMELPLERPLTLSDAFPCPICRQGRIEAIVLTEAFACEFCRHILSANLVNQQVQVVDSSQPLTWSWNGRTWRLARGEKEQALSGMILLLAVLLIVVPAGVIWLSGNLFPPLHPTSSTPFSTVWAMVTLFAHSLLVFWLFGEYYQLPFYVAAKLRVLRLRLFSQR